jgi:hypothetical protein
MYLVLQEDIIHAVDAWSCLGIFENLADAVGAVTQAHAKILKDVGKDDEELYILETELPDNPKDYGSSPIRMSAWQHERCWVILQVPINTECAININYL